MKKIISIAIVLCIVLALAVYFNTEKKPVVWIDYTVRDGDTLCDISKSITPNSEDYRETQYYIIEKNNLANAMIYPEQKILIPCKEKAADTNLKSLGTFKLTAYCACSKCCGKSDGITASGVKATAGRTIAVDTNKIPFGTKVIIDGHEYVAEDRGGAIKGNKIDIFCSSHAEAIKFGVQYKEVFAG